MPTPRKIGILGGMGPEATVLLMQKIIDATPVQDDRDHIPMIVDNNPQVPSRIDALIHGTGENPGPVLQRMARDLEGAGAEALIMPCNTAHHYAGFIETDISVPFLNMISLTCEKLASELPAGSRIGLLASPAVRLSRLFEAELARVGMEPVYATDDDALLRIIRVVKAGGPTPDAVDGLNALARELEAAGVAGILVACTEFSLLRKSIVATVPVSDSLDVIVQAAVDFALGDSL
ncbi:aspartate/glutamate racemase family protein [Candidatus Halocynthiibacter alkanivorans]|uniref:aspartate/glutamate racemase family protein n=1 Tax=Candidatus Halocynthiibacter alkanivorans TaxID=2267619 RepID=UPI000DF1FA7B|nr:amino acid racemase [Candidatus Halocynthiibacter alkanivorans]